MAVVENHNLHGKIRYYDRETLAALRTAIFRRIF